MPTIRLEDKSRFDLNYRDGTKTEIAFHSHVEYEIYYFHEGSCRYLIGDKIYSISPGDLIIMHGLTLHRPIILEKEAYVRSTIHFDSEYFKELLKGMRMEVLLQPFISLQSHRINLKPNEREEFEESLKRMNIHNKKEDDISTYRFQLAFMEVLTLLYSYFKTALKNKAENEVPFDKAFHVQRVISFIEHHYMKDLSLETIEKELHLSKFYLSKVFKNVTGFTVFNYLYHRRINQAKINFLVSPDHSITDISYRVGFKYPAHFTRVFKKLTGVTPEQYKKSLLL
ncbi:AraC family transcriptional regulator [Sutcliffiella horikoshii]|uniref:AraC family transcriptional regulator n=1 Tax=Sutcliffiella horikoshii TaxID=79883 RepID=UPI001CFE3A53|nr:AraC family transcriptional regulator [Sutcliffiella horikoshii]